MNEATDSLTPLAMDVESYSNAVLELSDGTLYTGISFGAEQKSVAGECVFQTGMYYAISISISFSDLVFAF